MRLVFFFFLSATFVVVGVSQLQQNRAVVDELDREITRRSQKRQKREWKERKKEHLVESEGYKRDD